MSDELSAPLLLDPNDPFPLLAAGAHTYGEAQEHSDLVDKWLGLKTYETEQELVKRGELAAGQQHWIGLPVRSMLTPYTEIRSMLDDLKPLPGETIVDLGAGYGRMGFVIGRHYPGVRFIGYEQVVERVTEARRAFKRGSYPGIEMRVLDLSAQDGTPARAEYYFVYDYGTREAIEKTLEDLKVYAQKDKVTVVGRGRASRDAIERQHPWLSQIVPPEHRGNYSIYRSA